MRGINLNVSCLEITEQRIDLEMLAHAKFMRQVKYFYQMKKHFCFLLAVCQGYLFSYMLKQKYELPAVPSASD